MQADDHRPCLPLACDPSDLFGWIAVAEDDLGSKAQVAGCLSGETGRHSIELRRSLSMPATSPRSAG